MCCVDSKQERIHRLPYPQYAVSLAALLACILLQSDLDGYTLDTPCQKQGNVVYPRHATFPEHAFLLEIVNGPSLIQWLIFQFSVLDPV